MGEDIFGTQMFLHHYPDPIGPLLEKKEETKPFVSRGGYSHKERRRKHAERQARRIQRRHCR
mgnify:CR=1 FL=1